MSSYYVAVDLRSNQLVLVLIDDQDRQVWKGRLVNELELVLMALAPYRGQVAGVAVESTYNWYWLVDGLKEAGYEVQLVNPAAVKKYEGLKHQDDVSDAYWLAHLLRLGILPTGYIYPRERRGLRDLARKRLRLVSQQTVHILSLESLYNRCLSRRLRASPSLPGGSGRTARCPLGAGGSLESADSAKFSGADSSDRKAASASVGARRGVPDPADDRRRGGSPGGYDLAGDGRSPTISESRQVCLLLSLCGQSENHPPEEERRRQSQKRESILSLGLAGSGRRSHPLAKEGSQFLYQSQKAKKGPWVAHKALAHKLCRAGYFMLRDQVAYSSARLFG